MGANRVLQAFFVLTGLGASLLAGCSGSGGTANAVTAVTPSPSPSPNPHPAPDNATVTFIKTTTDTVSAPSAAPTSTSTTTTFTATVHTGATFNGQPAIDIRQTSANGDEVDDTYEEFVPTSTGQNYVELGSTGSLASIQGTFTQSLPVPFINDELPEVAGARWTNSPAFNYSETLGPPYNYKRTEVRDANANDTITETQTSGNPPATVTTTSTLKADGTAMTTTQDATGTYSTTAGLPVQRNGAYVIPITNSGPSGTTTSYVPDWYPGGALPPSPIMTDTSVDLGVEALPAACSAAPQIPATHIQRTWNSFQAFGKLRTEVDDSFYAPSRGVLCAIYALTTRQFDWTNTGTLKSTEVNTNVWALTSGIGILSGHRGTASVAIPIRPAPGPALRSAGLLRHGPWR